MRVIANILIITAAVLSGCATPIPLDTLKYEQKTSVKSSRVATVVVQSGAVRGASGSYLMPAGGIYIPISTGPVPALQFNSEDQQAFGESLRSEIVRLGVVKSATGDIKQTSDLKVRVIFAQTYHNPNLQEYILDVVAEITGGKESLLRQYRVLSSEKDTLWEKFNTNAYEGKAKASKLLMEKLVPDIEGYISTM